MRLARVGLLLVLPLLACSEPTNVGDILRVAQVDVDPPNASVVIGGTLQLAATPRTESGIVLNNRTITWTSSDESIAEVSSSGIVTAKKVGGPIEITATADDVPGIASVLISAKPITRITIAPSQTSVSTGNSVQLQATAYNSSNQVVAGATFTWQSSNPGIADVSTSGIVLGVSAGGPVTITARNGEISGTTSVSVTQAQAVPNRLAFTQQPPDGTAGQPLSEPVRVAIRDSNGNTVTSANSPVSVRLGNNPTGATLSGTLTVSASSGVATFNNLVVDRGGSNYTLVAFAGGLTDAISASFDIAAAPLPPPPSQPTLTIQTQPSATAPSGSTLVQQPVILMRDGSNNPVIGAVITASIATGGGTLNGDLTKTTDTNGLATFTDLGITGSPGNRTLRFDAPNATGVISNSIAITDPTGPASQLIITVQPSTLAVRGVAFLQQPVIQVTDAGGRSVNQAGIQVTAAIASGPGTANLGGTKTIATNSAGQAEFTDLSINRSGVFTLRFTASHLQSVTSNAITIP